MVHLDVKKVGRIPSGGGWRLHGRDSEQARATGRAKSAGAKRGYVYLHSIIDGFSRLAYTEPLADEKDATAAARLARATLTHRRRTAAALGAPARWRHETIGPAQPVVPASSKCPPRRTSLGTPDRGLASHLAVVSVR